MRREALGEVGRHAYCGVEALGDSEALVSHQVEARMICRHAPWSRPNGGPARVVPALGALVDDGRECAAGSVTVDGLAEPGGLRLVVSVEAAADHDAVGVELHPVPETVRDLQEAALRRLVRRLVRTEPHVAIWPEDRRRAGERRRE